MPEPVPPPPLSRRLGALALGAIGVSLLWVRGGPGPEAVSGDGVTAAPEHAPGRILVDFVDTVDTTALAAMEARLGAPLIPVGQSAQDAGLYASDVADVAVAVTTLQGDPLVEVAEADVEMHLIEDAPRSSAALPVPSPSRAGGYPDDPGYDRQWNLGMIGAQAGWRAGGGEGVIVAVIDTGVSPLPDLPAERILPGKSFVPGTTSAADDQGHGTHVAGTIAQATNNGLGVAGVAPGAIILPIKVLSATGSGRSEWIAAGIDEAARQGAQVINLSLGGGHSDIVVRAVERARKKGIVVVAAAGNAGREGLASPADAKSALGVTSVGPGDELAPYSSWGKGVEIAAPGGDTSIPGGGIVQATIDGKGGMTLAEYQGTSMATPHVAGAAAVLFGAGARDADEVEALLRSAADGREDPLRFGAGRLDLGGALAKLTLFHRGVTSVSAAVVGLALAVLAGLRGPSRIATVLTSTLIAGGAWVLLLLPLPPSGLLSLAARPLLEWPGPFWSGFPLWQSAALPILLGLIFGASRMVGPLVLGLAAGIAAALLHGAVTGSSGMWWLPFGWDTSWLALNGTAALLTGMAIAGLQRLRRRGEKVASR